MNDTEYKAKLNNKVTHLERDLKVAQDERDQVRADFTRFATWLRQTHPAVFAEYFKSETS